MVAAFNVQLDEKEICKERKCKKKASGRVSISISDDQSDYVPNPR